MRTLTIVSLLTLLAACEDRQVEVREAAPEPPGSAEEHAPESSGSHGSPEVTGDGAETDEPEVGLVVEVLDHGDGRAIHHGSTVRVHYEAWLAEAHAQDGEPFDSSVSRLIPLELRLGGAGPGVIEGLTRGLLGLRAGTRALIRIPADLGWGAAGNPSAGIAPDSDLVYEVRVVSVL